ncbi:fumarylacetoacetate hydrolase family protein [Evansella sp. LMS18]|uniref:fumarylacetoacetate hydrolase family protein n=1 Tax=Evansella sp. LMS18 TaxID=2924033 RepID=UPI0020D1DE46|nr:fumarylacetoacetate hydrolase family protein [Evansella sp. LMS18]UTR11933.1 fumarylacetoacetate hydrolase family protein [Evansella sp. LMS18]
MKFVTFTVNDQEKVGFFDEGEQRVTDLKEAQQTLLSKDTMPADMIACIKENENFTEDVKEVMKAVQEGNNQDFSYPLSEVKLHAPIPRPRKNILCVGKNYREHAIEMGSAADIPEHPMLFSKLPTTVTGPEKTILNHQHVTSCLDYEGELALIIGKEGKDISRDEALNYVFGYTILNDVTARDRQKRHKQYLLGKSLDTSCPMGPYITHSSAVPDPHSLAIETKVNGEVRQSSNTEKFIFDIPEIISVISAGTTLEPGDIIATGTPAGVGNGFKPPRFLQPGDRIEITVEGLGCLRNTVQN